MITTFGRHPGPPTASPRSSATPDTRSAMPWAASALRLATPTQTPSRHRAPPARRRRDLLDELAGKGFEPRTFHNDLVELVNGLVKLPRGRRSLE